MFAFANAGIIAVYTVVDGLGVRAEVAAGGNALRYVMLLFVLDGVAYPSLVWLRRGAAGRGRHPGLCAPALAARGARRQCVDRLVRDRAVGDDTGAGRERSRRCVKPRCCSRRSSAPWC